LHINCVGEGSPTMILESGLGTMSADWANVQPEVAKTTRVCAYDRAGTGWSEPGPEPRDPRQIARELHALLGKAGIDGPYVLVGQSFGGLYARMYAARYPNEVEGMVLVDASHPGMWTRLPPKVVATLKSPAWRVGAMTFLTRLGVFRLTGGDMAGCELPARQCEEESISPLDPVPANLGSGDARARPGCPSARHRRSGRQAAGGVERGRS
jgi:pimeloyl-ACP methyl ester carboxylesterase